MRRSNTHRIAHERISYLYDLALRTARDETSLSATAVSQLRKIAMRYAIMIPPDKKFFCKSCNKIFVPGRTCTVRIRNNKRIITRKGL